MTPEERVLEDIKSKIRELMLKISELKVSEEERDAFNKERSEYSKLCEDYKRHKAWLIEREKKIKEREEALNGKT